jgi:hypothetical protein
MTNAMPVSLAPDVSRAHHLLALIFGHVQTHLIHVVARLRLADLLQEGPRSLAVLAEATSTDTSTLARVMQALTRPRPGGRACDRAVDVSIAPLLAAGFCTWRRTP